MEIGEIIPGMTPVEALTVIVSVLVCLSVASERLVEIIKGIVPFLNEENENTKKEGWRRSVLQFLAVCSGIATAFLAKPALVEVLPGAWTTLPAVFALGFLASGGSGLWNSVLTYVRNVKDIKKWNAKELGKKYLKRK